LKTVDACVLAALRQELEPLAALLSHRSTTAGLEFLEGEVHGLAVRAVVAGVGKVAAARAAALLCEPRPRLGLFVVGVCGGLEARQPIGALVHCSQAVQCDLFLPRRGEEQADEGLRAAWEATAPGQRARFLTSDRAAVMPWRRWARRRRFGPGAGVADMETAAAAWVARTSGVPWAALRAVSDTQGLRAALSFRHNFAAQAPRAASTLPALFQALASLPPAPSTT
jgi:adenosylhomocysteine nucleosidase